MPIRDQQSIQIGSPTQAIYYIKFKLYALINFTCIAYSIIQIYILLFNLLKSWRFITTILKDTSTRLTLQLLDHC